MPFILLAVAACCAVPLLVGGLLPLAGRRKEKVLGADEARLIEAEKNP